MNAQMIVGDRLKVKISCYGQANSRWLQSGHYSISQLCNDNRTARSACWIISCVRSPNRVTLVSPRTSTVLDTPILEWRLVEGAIYYEIRVSSHTGRTVQAKTKKTQYQLPVSYQFLPGESYEIKIFATTEKRYLTEGIFSIRVPQNDEIRELEETLTQIKNSSVSEIDKIQLVDTSYLSYGLIEHSIAYLEKEFSRTDYTKLAVLLADRYAEVNNPIKAKQYYEIVIRDKRETSEDFPICEENAFADSSLE